MMIHNTPPLLLINSVAMLHETQDLKTKKAQISMIFCIMSVIIFLDRDFLRPASPLFSPSPSTKPVLFIPGPGSQNQMFGLASVHNG